MTSYKSLWSIEPGVTYLNHGSFGPSPIVVQQARSDWTKQLESQPMGFFCQRMEEELRVASERLGRFVGASREDLLFVDNATVGMNIASTAFELSPGDEVVLTDHEYGAVKRLWQSKCECAGAQLRIAELPFPLSSPEAIVHSTMDFVSSSTRVIIVSHVTSQTAAILPVSQICQAARRHGIPVIVDGPHAVAMLPLDLSSIGCAFYTASCHKWLSGPFGSGFLYVQPEFQSRLNPAYISWGSSIAGLEADWRDEFQWIGTRDPAAALSVTTAIDFMEELGFENFQSHGHQLAQYARRRAEEELGGVCLVPDCDSWYGPMVTISIPKPTDWEAARHGRIDALQKVLRDKHRIEVPIFSWRGHRCLRVSAHLYNCRDDIDRLFDALHAEKDF